MLEVGLSSLNPCVLDLANLSGKLQELSRYLFRVELFPLFVVVLNVEALHVLEVNQIDEGVADVALILGSLVKFGVCKLRQSLSGGRKNRRRF